MVKGKVRRILDLDQCQLKKAVLEYPQDQEGLRFHIGAPAVY